ncbi:MAG: alkaline phosphatase family protein, partial [Bacteroidales bacterium]|nr:alkaline phosphatase family protein [Bacteroidales bacterium]
MPALDSLVNNGTIGNIATLEPPFSPMLWTSIATGKHADKHGILGFTEPSPDGNGVRPITSTSRKVKAIWNILMQEGYKTHVAGWWPSNPVEPINGVMLSNHYPKAHGGLKNWGMPQKTVHPKNLTGLFADLRIHPSELTQEHLLPFVPLAAKIDQEKDQRLYQVAKNIAEAASLHSATTWIMENMEWDFMAIYLDTIDHFCHGFMDYHPPRRKNIPEDQFELYKDVVNASYRFHDMMLETLLKLAGEDTTVVLVSDHGFHSDHLRPDFIPAEPAGPAYQHRDHGVICIKGPGIKKDERVYGANLLNIAPTLLTICGLPIGQDMDGTPLMQIFENPPELKTIPSWEDVEGNCGTHDDDYKEDPRQAHEALQQLIELGYIEDPGEDKKAAAEKATAELNYNLGRVYLSTSKYDKAIEVFKELWNNDKSEARYALYMLNAYLETGRFTEFVELLLECKIEIPSHILKPADLKTIRNEIKILNEDKDNPEAENKAKELSQQLRKNSTLQGALAQLQFLEIDYFLCQNQPLKVKELMPKEETIENYGIAGLMKYGNLFIKLQNWEKAEKSFRNVLEKNPESHTAHDGLALTFLGKKDYYEAANFALDAIGLMYHYPNAHLHLGQALIGLEDYENAAKALEVCLRMAPGLGIARNLLIDIYNNNLNNAAKADEHKNFFSNKETAEAEALHLDTFASVKRKVEEPIFVVSGLPRSGTSLMMQMLDIAGLPIF